ncbi:MAG: pyridoxal-phosphate dependent enzyme [bacterium]
MKKRIFSFLMFTQILFLSQQLISAPLRTEIIGQDTYNITSILNSWTKPLTEKNLAISEGKKDIPLFKAFPNLTNKLSFIKLGEFPTPIEKLENLGKELGLQNLYLKDDGISRNPFGGNKIRKLEFLLADALDNNVKTIITVGAAGSNHTLATATCCEKLALNSIVMLTPQLNTKYLQRNLLLSHYHKAQINYYEESDARDVDIEKFYDERSEKEKVPPYFIAAGGSTPLGVIGFINAVFELKEQIEAKLIPEPDFIYVTLGSCGTAAGLILGVKLAGLKSKIIPVRVSSTAEEKLERLIELFNETSKFLNDLDPDCPIIKFPEDVLINNDFAGNEYAQITQQAHDAIKILDETEDIKLDGTYSGKAFSALIDEVSKNKNELRNKTVLFWDTFCAGDFSEITNTIDYKKLPENLHFYFEQNLQELDLGC